MWLSLIPACASQVLFALCSLLRHFPYAQQQFLKLGGLQVLRSLVQEETAKVLAVRVVTLLYDLVTEKVGARTRSALPFALLCARLWWLDQSALPDAALQPSGWTDEWMGSKDVYQRMSSETGHLSWIPRAGREGGREEEVLAMVRAKCAGIRRKAEEECSSRAWEPCSSQETRARLRCC